MAPWCKKAAPPELFDVVIYLLMHSIWIFNVIIGSIGMYQLSLPQSKKKIKTRFKYLFTGIALTFCIAPPSFAFSRQAGWECWYDSFRPWQATSMMGLFCYCSGLILLNIFFYLRLTAICEDTIAQLHLSKATKVLFWMAITIQVISGITAIAYFLTAWDKDIRANALRWKNVFLYTNIINSVIVLLLFIKKLTILSKFQSPTEHLDLRSAKQPTLILKDKLAISVKYFICASTAVLFTLSLVIVGFIRDAKPNDLKLRTLNIFVHVVDTAMNMLMLFIQFPMNQKLFDNLCRPCKGIVKKTLKIALNLEVVDTVEEIQTRHSRELETIEL